MDDVRGFALVVLDLQRVVLPGGIWAIPGTEELAARVASIARDHRGPVLATRHRLVGATVGGGTAAGAQGDRWAAFADRWREELDRDPSWWELAPALQGLPVADKTTYSAWRLPELRELARDAGGLIVVGVETDCCVAATVLDAIDDGIAVAVATDLVLGPDVTGHTGVLVGLSRLPEQVRLATAEALGIAHPAAA